MATRVAKPRKVSTAAPAPQTLYAAPQPRVQPRTAAEAQYHSPCNSHSNSGTEPFSQSHSQTQSLLHSPPQSHSKPQAQIQPQLQPQVHAPLQAPPQAPPQARLRQPRCVSVESPLFREYTARYLSDPRVRTWLMCREPEGVRFADTFETSLSFACLYHLPGANKAKMAGAARHQPQRNVDDQSSSVSSRSGNSGNSRNSRNSDSSGNSGNSGNSTSSTSAGAAFLDAGDFMMFHHTYDQFAVGTLYTTREHHVLAQLRESVGETSLSTRPKARRFVTDLSVDALEMLEFSWLQDDSLIINCRRLRKPVGGPIDRDDALAIQGDILFYGVIPPGTNPGTPFKRMILFEKPVVCSSCGAQKFHSCRCPARFKRRAPAEDEEAVKTARKYGGALDAARATTSASFATGAVGSGGGVISGNILDSQEDGAVRRMRQISTLANFTSRLYSIEQQGAFFVRWFQRRPGTSKMSVWLEPNSPIPYQFLCGTRRQTSSLASLFIRNMNLGGSSLRSDARFYGSLTSGAGSIGAVLGNGHGPSYSSILDDCAEQDCMQQRQRGGFDGLHKSSAPVQSSAPLNAWEHEASRKHAVFSRDNQQLQNVASVPHARPLSKTVAPASGVPLSSNVVLANNLTTSQPALPVGLPVPSNLLAFGSGLAPAGVAQLQDHTVAGSQTPVHFQQMRREREASLGYPVSLEVQPQPRPRVDLEQEVGLVDSLPNPPVGSGTDALQEANASVTPTPSGSSVDHVIATSGSDAEAQSTGEGQATGSSQGEEPRIVVGPSGLPACSECGAEFKKTGNLTRHIQTVHLKKRPFACTECSARFGYKTHLNRHIQTVHNKDKCTELSCNDCNRTFRTRQQLDRHQSQSHSCGAKADPVQEEIKCDLCGHEFSQRSNLNRHIQSIHQGLRHSCSACPASFGQRFDLQRHTQRAAEGGDAAHAMLLAQTQKQ